MNSCRGCIDATCEDDACDSEVHFIFEAGVGTLMRCAKMMPAEESLSDMTVNCYEKEMCHPMN